MESSMAAGPSWAGVGQEATGPCRAPSAPTRAAAILVPPRSSPTTSGTASGGAGFKGVNERTSWLMGLSKMVCGTGALILMEGDRWSAGRMLLEAAGARPAACRPWQPAAVRRPSSWRGAAGTYPPGLQGRDFRSDPVP